MLSTSGLGAWTSVFPTFHCRKLLFDVIAECGLVGHSYAELLMTLKRALVYQPPMQRLQLNSLIAKSVG